MTRYPNLDAYALFYEKIDSGNPHASQSESTKNPRHNVPGLPKEQLAQISRDLKQPMSGSAGSNPHRSQD